MPIKQMSRHAAGFFQKAGTNSQSSELPGKSAYLSACFYGRLSVIAIAETKTLLLSAVCFRRC
jgi:hypothetical protein